MVNSMGVEFMLGNNGSQLRKTGFWKPSTVFGIACGFMSIAVAYFAYYGFYQAGSAHAAGVTSGHWAPCPVADARQRHVMTQTTYDDMTEDEKAARESFIAKVGNIDNAGKRQAVFNEISEHDGWVSFQDLSKWMTDKSLDKVFLVFKVMETSEVIEHIFKWLDSGKFPTEADYEKGDGKLKVSELQAVIQDKAQTAFDAMDKYDAADEVVSHDEFAAYLSDGKDKGGDQAYQEAYQALSDAIQAKVATLHNDSGGDTEVSQKDLEILDPDLGFTDEFKKADTDNSGELGTDEFPLFLAFEASVDKGEFNSYVGKVE